MKTHVINKINFVGLWHYLIIFWSIILSVTCFLLDSKSHLECSNSLPSDYGIVCGNWNCSDWAGRTTNNRRNYCNDDWSSYRHCVSTSNGLIKDFCRASCGLCGIDALDYIPIIIIFRKYKKTNEPILRKIQKGPIYRPFWTNLGQIWGKTFFFQKSGSVNFLDLLKANLMQKIRKN